MFRAKQRSAQELFQENRVVKLKPVQFRARQRLLSLQKWNISRQLSNKTHLAAIGASLAPTNWGQRNRYQNCRGSRTPTWPVQFSSTRPDRYGTRREPKPDEGRTPSGFAFVRQLGHRAPGDSPVAPWYASWDHSPHEQFRRRERVAPEDLFLSRCQSNGDLVHLDIDAVELPQARLVDSTHSHSATTPGRECLVVAPIEAGDC